MNFKLQAPHSPLLAPASHKTDLKAMKSNPFDPAAPPTSPLMMKDAVSGDYIHHETLDTRENREAQAAYRTDIVVANGPNMQPHDEFIVKVTNQPGADSQGVSFRFAECSVKVKSSRPGFVERTVRFDQV